MKTSIQYILAEQLLKIGVKNLSQSDKNKLYKLIKEATTEKWITVAAPNIKVAFAAGASDSTAFINDIWTKVKAAIDANADAKALYDANNLAVQAITVYAGSSNNFNNTPTNFDTYNYDSASNLKDWGKADTYDKGMYNTTLLKKAGININFTNETMKTGYTANLELAKKRGADIATKLKTKLIENNILIPDVTKGQFFQETIMPGVIDTGGFLDKNRNTTEHPNPGQMATIYVTLSGKQMVQTIPASVQAIADGLKPKDGKPAVIKWGNWMNQSGTLLTGWELKYMPNEGTGQNTYVMPVVRWTFEYDNNNALIKVTQIPDPGGKGVPSTVTDTFPAKEFVINPPGKASLAQGAPEVKVLLDAAGVFNRFFGSAVP